MERHGEMPADKFLHIMPLIIPQPSVAGRQEVKSPSSGSDRMRAHHTPTPPFGYRQMGQAGSGSSPKVRGGRRKESAGQSAV